MKHQAGQYYHIYNRGVTHQKIFGKRGNYTFLIRTIQKYLSFYDLTFIAYCLMPNHYHFLIRVNADDQLSPFVQRLFNAYSQAYNRQQDRTGTLFEGRAQYRLVDTTEYVLQLARYIHLNPVSAGLAKLPEEWEFSNYREWIGIRNGKLVDLNFVRDFYPDLKSYAAFVHSELPEDLREKVSAFVIEREN
jgi:REP element-mobilizing transposase RayT